MRCVRVVALCLVPTQEPPQSLDAWRVRLEAPSAAAREAAAAELRQELRTEQLDEALAALAPWAPTPALHLRGLLVDLPLLRAGLLERACEQHGGELARELLVESFRARADALAPMRADVDAASEPRLPWANHGIYARRTGAPRAAIDWFALRRVFVESRAWSQPVILFPGVSDASFAAPLVAQAPAEGWLGIELSRRDLVALRRVVATWIVPADRAPRDERTTSLRRGHELASLLAAEEALLRQSLLALAGRTPFERGRLGADLLASLGLPCLPMAGRDDPFARGIVEALEAQGRSTPTDAADPSEPPQRSPSELRADLLACAEGIDAPARDLEAARRELRDCVDALADRLERETLLGGEIAEKLRSRAAKLPADAPARALLEAAAGELWTLCRGARPGTLLVELPPGSR